jgi:hypothetical protein
MGKNVEGTVSDNYIWLEDVKGYQLLFGALKMLVLRMEHYLGMVEEFYVTLCGPNWLTPLVDSYRLEKRRQAMMEMPKMIQEWKEASIPPTYTHSYLLN